LLPPQNGWAREVVQVAIEERNPAIRLVVLRN
jgi:hypothetical protein